MTPHEMSQALIRIADIGIVHYSETDVLREAAEMIELLAERIAIMEEGKEYGFNDPKGIRQET